MNETARKFGYPATLVAAFEHWMVLVRPGAVTLGSLVLLSSSEAKAFGALVPEAFAEQARVVGLIERALRRFTRYEKLNYIMLMMVDPHVHFHVIPRYGSPRALDGVDYPDAGWPGLPDLKSARPLGPTDIARMVAGLREAGLEDGNPGPPSLA